MFNKKIQYVIKTVPTEDKNALENLLNEMSMQGWDLYSMHEVENDENIDFNCIFMRERQKEEEAELEDIVNITSFKYRMEKMLSEPTNPYDSCKEIQLKIINQKNKIKNIKLELDKEGLSVADKNELNNQMSNELKQLELLKKALIENLSPDVMYSSLKEEKFTICLSEEILELISFDVNENILTETVKIRQKLTDELGYIIPQINFHNSDALSQFEFCIKIHDIEVFRSVVFPDYVAYYKTDLKGYKISKDAFEIEDEISGKKIVWIPKEEVKDFWNPGMSPVEYIGKAIEYVAIKEVSDILDYNDINKYIEIVLENNSFLVDNIVPDFLTASDIKYLLSCLIREHVSIKNIIYLFEKINDYANEPTKEDLLSKVRLAFSKHILKDLTKENELKLIEFNDDTLDKVYAFLGDEDSEDAVIRIDAEEVQVIAESICKLAKTKKMTHPAIAVPMELRHMLFVILSEFIPDITVLALEELVPGYSFKFVGKV